MRTPGSILRGGLAAVLATAGLAVLGPVTSAHADPVGAGWTLAFSDEFNGSAVDTAKWNYRTDVKAYSAQRPQNVSISGGAMNIALRQESYGGKDFTGGGLVSKQKLRYGYYETRAKINDGSGWHSAFWLQAGDGSTTFPAEQRTEIDGFEIDSIQPQRLRHNVITWRGSAQQAPTYYTSGVYDIGFDLRQWHTYGVDWAERSVRYYVDGVLKATQPYTPEQWTHDYTAIWLTSIAYGTVPDVTKLPSAVQFDYVRYWQRDYYVDNDGPAAYGYTETGSWSNSALTGWTYASPTRYATCAVAGATATWRPNLRAAGTYQVYAYKVAASGSDPNQRYDTAHDGTVSTSYLDGTSGSSGWVLLGSWYFPAGTGGYLRTTASGSGCARADAVKFVRV
ncbi:family 16 glycosylhydrolase [Micromonospora vulcania]|uniref:Family 16 glycosylhydrolase n=1 Tax=Micromonospora vulcania TaxID=1441873 RepID=A0ABW1H638_9ACTN